MDQLISPWDQLESDLILDPPLDIPKTSLNLKDRLQIYFGKIFPLGHRTPVTFWQKHWDAIQRAADYRYALHQVQGHEQRNRRLITDIVLRVQTMNHAQVEQAEHAVPHRPRRSTVTLPIQTIKRPHPIEDHNDLQTPPPKRVKVSEVGSPISAERTMTDQKSTPNQTPSPYPTPFMNSPTAAGWTAATPKFCLAEVIETQKLHDLIVDDLSQLLRLMISVEETEHLLTLYPPLPRGSQPRRATGRTHLTNNLLKTLAEQESRAGATAATIDVYANLLWYHLHIQNAWVATVLRNLDLEAVDREQTMAHVQQKHRKQHLPRCIPDSDEEDTDSDMSVSELDNEDDHDGDERGGHVNEQAWWVTEDEVRWIQLERGMLGYWISSMQEILGRMGK